MTDPHVPSGPFRRLAIEDAPELQELFERCGAFFLLTEGVEAPPDAAAKELATVIPGRTAEETFCLGIDRAARLAGFVHLTRNHPKDNEWWIALMLLDPSSRGAGFGSELHRALCEWIAAQAGTTLWLGVLEQNEAAERFWRRVGYRERERQRWTAESGLESNIILMSLDLR